MVFLGRASCEIYENNIHNFHHIRVQKKNSGVENTNKIR